MEPSTTTMLQVGDWCVNPASGQISREGETIRLEVRAMRLLLSLAERAGQVVSIEELLDQVWSGVTVSPDSVYQAVASLRRVLGDNPKNPAYIATVPRLGYRMIAAVRPWPDPPNGQTSAPASSSQPPSSQLSSPPLSSAQPSGSEDPTPPIPDSSAPGSRPLSPGLVWAGGGVLSLSLALIFLVFLFYGRPQNHNPPTPSATAPQSQKSIAVLPFLDLTDKMNEEPFADGMTEELIDKLSKIPDLEVPSPTSSFYFKGKQVPVAEIAKSLGVAYVLDGSVRKSGSRLRVAARLIRADNGYVIWSESYDRPFDDILMIQDDIAGEVTKALRDSIGNKPAPNNSGGDKSR